jgi:hypothetical protein
LHTLQSLQGKPGGDYRVALDPDGVSGLLTIDVGMGDVVVRFSHNSERAELTLTIVKKPMLVPASMIWAGTSQVLRRAAEQECKSDPESVDGD